MAKLFSKNKLIDLTAKIDTQDILEYIDIVKTWHQDYYNGSLKQDKETSREQAYNQDFFIKILGYKEKPAPSYTIEPKATTDKGQLPDVVLGYTDITKNIINIASVVELKSASIPLDRPQRREGNMSPVQQGFKYKTQYRNCPFVIISNFFEFRLYQDNQLDFEIWTLDDLINPENDYLHFKTWYILLKSENFVSSQGISKTESLLSDIRIEQEEISNEFYKKYRNARLELLRNIFKCNPNIRSNFGIGIEKAQKIIDRIVFACFAEDRGLLPDNTIQRVIKAADSSVFGGSLWNTLKGFFEAIDTGSEKLEIPSGYNGGLFRRDDVLNRLQVDDEPLRKVMELSSYNFHEDLSVNILGHIFEQSITDLEEIRNKVSESQNLETISYSRRKQDGIFYTPDYIVRYIVDNTLGTYLHEHEEKLKNEFKLKGDINDKNYEKREKQAYGLYQDLLQRVKVLDPACGSGAFLVYVFDYLLAENKRVASILGNNLFSSEDYIKSILQNNIYGVDLNEESVEITKLSLWLKTAQKGKKLTALDKNIKCGNSLINDPLIAQDKAFNWEIAFADVYKNGGFDVVVGNPPYEVLSEKESGIKNIDKVITYIKNDPILSQGIKGKNNLYKLFICKGISLLNDTGYLSFIVPMALLADSQAQTVRKMIFENTTLVNIECFPQKDDPQNRVFEDAKLSTCIFLIKKGIHSEEFQVRSHPGKKIESDAIDALKLRKEDIFKFDAENLTIPSCNKHDWNIIKKIINQKYFVKLGNFIKQYQGEINETNQRSEGVLTQDKSYPPILRGANITMYAVREASQGEDFFLNDTKYLKGKNENSKAIHHNFERLGFQRSSPQNNFRRIIAAIIPKGLYCFDTVSYITEESSKIDLDILVGIFNSILYDWYFRCFSTNSKINEYQLNMLPYFKTSNVNNTTITNLLTQESYAEILNILEQDIQSKNEIPNWVNLIFKDLSLKIQEIEKKRIIQQRKDRSKLDDKSQKYQLYINKLLAFIYKLSEDEFAYIEKRRKEML